MSIPNDGLDALRAELSLKEIMRLIERTARWVDPETFRLLPVWYPEYSRRALFYKANWSEPQMNRNRETGIVVHKHEGNRYANKALTRALGLRSSERPIWSCCHIWGIDDASYASTNVIVQDPRYYSCVANMVLLPTPLKAFTDVMPIVKAMLRTCSFYTYGWRCEHDAVAGIDVTEAGYHEDYPSGWPNADRQCTPSGMVPINADIRRYAKRRLDQIRSDAANAGTYYPHKQVMAVCDYWNIAR
jgi:hypothetical protein